MSIYADNSMSATWGAGSNEGSGTGTGLSYGGYASVISGVSSVASSFAETKAFEDQLDARSRNYMASLKANADAAIQNVGNLMTSFELQQVQNKDNINNINHILGDKLSERGLSAMKEEALLRAGAAETGTTGGTTDMAVKEAFINENMDKANIVSSARQQNRAIFQAMDVADLRMSHQIDSILLGGLEAPQITEMNTSPIIAGLQGGLGAFTNTMNLMPMSERSQVFGIEPEGRS